MVRQRSAKPLCPSSNLGGTSKSKIPVIPYIFRGCGCFSFCLFSSCLTLKHAKKRKKTADVLVKILVRNQHVFEWILLSPSKYSSTLDLFQLYAVYIAGVMKYLLRKYEQRILLHFLRNRKFHNLRSKLFHILLAVRLSRAWIIRNYMNNPADKSGKIFHFVLSLINWLMSAFDKLFNR